MPGEKQKTVANRVTVPGLGLWFHVVTFSLSAFFPLSACWAVTSNITRHHNSADLLKGQAEDVVISSKGTLQLGRAWQSPVQEFENVWSINTIVVSGATIFVGTSPNGGIFKYSLGELTQIHPPASEQEQEEEEENEETEDQESLETQEPNDGETVEQEEHLVNEHIFAMATDMAGRLLAGISGDKCRLLRVEGEKVETIFEPNDAKYIFAIAVGDKGNIYLGTGPEGKVYRIDPFDPASTGLVYDSLDKNILSLAIGKDGFVYAGSDERGLVYRIDPKSKTATVLYDSEQPEVTALIFGQENELYAAATSAKISEAETKFAAQLPLTGRPEPPAEKEQSGQESEGGRKLQIPNSKTGGQGKATERKPPAPKPPKPDKASFIYKISEDGYVTSVFSEAVVLFAMAGQEGKLLVGTGNDAQVFTIEPASERQAIIYEDELASQITAVTVFGEDVYIGTSNPAKLIKLEKVFAAEGTYTSDLIDAGQPAKWGKLQIDADIPPDCKVMVACRSGNVKDINDPTFSAWTDPQEITGPLQLGCPLARFCQYKLVLQSPDGSKSPVVREIAVASTIPNLAPKVEAVGVGREQTPDKVGVFKIGYAARDSNGDKLIYKIDFRKLGRSNWIELEDETEADSFEWNGKTVEDGRYEVRVTASDERGNTAATKLTGSRISDPIIVDNTGPVIEELSVDKGQDSATLKLRVVDKFTTIGKVDYTVDSHAEWKGAVPDDLVFDTIDESFTIVIDDLKAGEHVISIRASDDVGNTTYK
ncbi:MAG: flagellar hook assembly protein FlgD, partial [Planctomycetota bacterium]